MSATKRASYDAIVVGAGHNGLTAAAYLARAGLSTLVLERRAIVGGACVTEEIAPGLPGLHDVVHREHAAARGDPGPRPRRPRPADGALRSRRSWCPFRDAPSPPWWPERERRSAELESFRSRTLGRSSARRRRAQAARPLSPAVLPRAASGPGCPGARRNPRGPARRQALSRDLGRRDRPHGLVSDREPRRLPRPQLRDPRRSRRSFSPTTSTASTADRTRRARARAPLPSPLGRRARAPGLLRPRDRRHGRDHAGDGGGRPAVRSRDRDRTRPSPASTSATDAPAASCSRTARVPRPAWCSPTPTRSAPSSASWTRRRCREEFRRAIDGIKMDGPCAKVNFVLSEEPRRPRHAARLHDPQRALFTLVPSLEFAERCYNISRTGRSRRSSGWTASSRPTSTRARARGPPRHDVLHPVRALPAEGRHLGREAGAPRRPRRQEDRASTRRTFPAPSSPGRS